MDEQHGKCMRCGRVLKTEKSRTAGYGPVCKRKAEAAQGESEQQRIQLEGDQAE